MKLKMIISVVLTVCAVVCLSLPIGAAEFDNAIYFGLIFRDSPSANSSSAWAKLTQGVGDSSGIGRAVSAGEYLQAGCFFTTESETFEVGYSYEIDIVVNCYNAANVTPSDLAKLNDCYFSASSVSPNSWGSLTATQLASLSNDPISSDNCRYSFDNKAGLVKAVYRPSSPHSSLCLRTIQWNSSDSKVTFFFKLQSIKIVRDVDGSHYDQKVAELLEQTNNKLDGIQGSINSGNQKLDGIEDSINSGNQKLDGINDSIDSGNEKLDGIKDSLDNAPNNEYDYIENKKGESKEDEDEAQDALNNLLPIEDIKTSFMDFFGAISSNNVAKSITLPAARMPSFAGGVQLWQEQQIDFSPWLNNSYISTIITVVKILSSIWMLYVCVSYVWNMLQEALGHDKMTDSGLLPSGGDDI